MNRLCQQCLKGCKQADNAKIVECKRYRPAPVQMEFKFKKSGKRRAKGSPEKI